MSPDELRQAIHDALSARHPDGLVWHADVENGTLLVSDLLRTSKLVTWDQYTAVCGKYNANADELAALPLAE